MTEMDKTDSRSDTTTDSSGQSMDVEPSSPINPSTSTNPTTSEQTSNQSRPGTSAGRRRKVPDSVTPNACTHCKKARAKVSLRFPVFSFRNVRWVVESQHTKLSTIV